MNVIQIISQKAAEHNLPFLLIGGYAVLAHGYVRTTSDVDLLARKNEAAEWRKILGDLGFTIFSAGENFLQFNPLPGGLVELDLMFADAKVFDRMLAEAVSTETHGAVANVVSLPHLFVLKCHAFHTRPRRGGKDIEDIVQLIKINKLDLNDASWQKILIEQGGQEFYELLKRECAEDDSA